MGEVRFMISEAAKKLQVEAHVLRYWEEELGLHIGRTEMGHRYYTEDDIQLFLCIQKLKNEGILLRELKTLIPKLTELRRKKTEEKNMAQAESGTSVHESRTGAGSAGPSPRTDAAGVAPSSPMPETLGGNRQNHASVAMARCLQKADSSKSVESVLASLTETSVDGTRSKTDFADAQTSADASGPMTEKAAATVSKMANDATAAVSRMANDTAASTSKVVENLATDDPMADNPATSGPMADHLTADNSATDVASHETTLTVPHKADAPLPGRAANDRTAEVIEVTHLEQVRALFGDVITEAITSNNQVLEKNISRRVTSNVCREIYLLFQAQEHQEEEHYRKLDQLIRQQQTYRREAAESAPVGAFKKLFT